ncbi:TlpA disulfide reductase family protein [Micromonospora sp. NPDC005979]|uniref:TlpA disulfide reductase family protein n=1 Tax=Micromonospora sp. NPDC005979 TaxID=3156726 RepID=UPI00339FB5E1
MVFLSTAVAILAALVLADLALTAAVVRRLRETEMKLIDMNSPPASGLPLGAAIPEFTAPGGQISRADLVGSPTLIGFFSAGCRHCPGQAAKLADRAEEIASGGVRVISFLTAPEESTEDLGPTLRKAGLLVMDDTPSAVMAAFQVQGTPTFVMFGADGRLAARSHDLGEVLSSR